MKFERICLHLFIGCFLISCSNNNKQKTINTAELFQTDSIIDERIEETIKLDNDFEIKVGYKEDFEIQGFYTLLIITHKNKQLYLDTSIIEYEFGDTLYPLFRKLDNENFELLIEINNRPNKNYLKYFKIKEDKIVSVEKLPTFISNQSNLDGDDNLELAGFWDWSETWGEDNSFTTYNPIIYYELKPSGITLDSILTIKKNTEIFGNFHGFNYNEKVELKTSANKKFDNEISKISKK